MGGSGLWIPGSGGMGGGAGGGMGGGLGGGRGGGVGGNNTSHSTPGQVGKGILEPAVPNVAKRNYRPPPGFMDKKIIMGGPGEVEVSGSPTGETRKKEDLIDKPSEKE